MDKLGNAEGFQGTGGDSCQRLRMQKERLRTKDEQEVNRRPRSEPEFGGAPVRSTLDGSANEAFALISWWGIPAVAGHAGGDVDQLPS